MLSLLLVFVIVLLFSLAVVVDVSLCMLLCCIDVVCVVGVVIMIVDVDGVALDVGCCDCVFEFVVVGYVCDIDVGIAFVGDVCVVVGVYCVVVRVDVGVASSCCVYVVVVVIPCVDGMCVLLVLL